MKNNESRSGGFSIGKNALYSMADAVFSVFVVASVEKYDPSVVRREMSSKKVYAFDSGMVSAVHFSTSGDRGKYLENFVFAHLRRLTPDIFFLKSGDAECDFIAGTEGGLQCIQVCQEVNASNVGRELKGCGWGCRVSVPKMGC